MTYSTLRRSLFVISQDTIETLTAALSQRPSSTGRFGRFGGQYVPETLMPALAELEAAFKQYRDDFNFQQEFQLLLRHYVGRPTPLVQWRV